MAVEQSEKFQIPNLSKTWAKPLNWEKFFEKKGNFQAENTQSTIFLTPDLDKWNTLRLHPHQTGLALFCKLLFKWCNSNACAGSSLQVLGVYTNREIHRRILHGADPGAAKLGRACLVWVKPYHIQKTQRSRRSCSVESQPFNTDKIVHNIRHQTGILTEVNVYVL